MIRLIVFLVLFSSLDCRAEWTLIFTDVNDTQYYVDLDNITQEDGNLIYSSMRSYSESQVGGAQSGVGIVRVDCIGWRYQTLNIRSYDKEMGRGKLMWEKATKESIWSEPAENSITDLYMDTVCRATEKVPNSSK